MSQKSGFETFGLRPQTLMNIIRYELIDDRPCVSDVLSYRM